MIPENLFICEKHFTPNQYYQYDTRTSVKEGELTKLNLPTKSVSKPTGTVSRSTSSIQKRDEIAYLQELSPPPSPSPFVYKNFIEFTQRISKLNLGDCWNININNNLVIITCASNKYVLPKYEIFVDHNLSFSLRIFGWMLQGWKYQLEVGRFVIFTQN